MSRARSRRAAVALAVALGLAWVIPVGAPPAAALAPMGAIDLSFRASGVLPSFPCYLGGCGVSFDGDAVAVTHATSSDEGYLLDPVWDFIGIVQNFGRYHVGFVATGRFQVSAVHSDPAMPYCPTTGAVAGTFTMAAPATGVVRRADPPAVGSVTGVTVELRVTVQRVGATAAVAAHGRYPVDVVVHYELGGQPGAFQLATMGAGAATFVLDPTSVAARCADPGPIPFSVDGSVLLELY